MKAEIQKRQETGMVQAQALTPAAHSQKLMQCIANLELKPPQFGDAEMALASSAKWELSLRTSELMPKGKPLFAAIVSYPSLARLMSEHGRAVLQKVLFMLIKDFCGTINVVRNMNEDQMIDAASILLDECGNFRLEDYVMMFSLAKRGELVKILDRIDVQVIGQMLDAYWMKRNAAGKAAQEAELELYERGLKEKKVSTKEADPFPELSGRLRELGHKLQEQIEAGKEADTVLQEKNRKKFVEAIRERWRGKL